MESISIVVLIGVAGTTCSIVFGYLGYQKGLKKDSYIEGSTKGTIESKLDYIGRRTDDVLLEQRETNKNLNALSERVTRVEESTKSAHKRLDTIEGRE